METLNDDNFEKLLNPVANGGKAKYILTPMGSMYISFSHKNIPISLRELRETWQLWEQFARKQYGRGSDISAVVFDCNGGKFQSIDSSV